MKRVLRPKYLAACGALLLASTALHAGTVIPEGTVLPARLNTTLSSKNAKPGQIVTARIMQNVPLPGGAKIPAGATLVGRVISVDPASAGNGGRISVRFDSLKTSHETIPIMVRLRAIASFMEVQHAQIPLMGADRGTPESAWTTIQIGGETVYRGGGPVEGRFGRVGEPVDGGVLSRLSANPDGGCNAGGPDDLPQALWLFSSDACGTYSLPNVFIAHAGRTAPVGEIILHSDKGNVTVHSGSGLLLRVNGDADPQA